MYELIKPGDTLLDVGIGTGLSSVLFHKFGVHVSGMDNSMEMLNACKSEGITTQLACHDLRKIPWPYADRKFDHIVSLGVLNHIRDLERVFEEMSRITKDDGFCGFTVEEQDVGQREDRRSSHRESDDDSSAQNRNLHFKHSSKYIDRLLAEAGFLVLKELVFLAFVRPGDGKEVFFRAYVARKQTEPVGS
jgi:predicted TPR repeat methyltransferase